MGPLIVWRDGHVRGPLSSCNDVLWHVGTARGIDPVQYPRLDGISRISPRLPPLGLQQPWVCHARLGWTRAIRGARFGTRGEAELVVRHEDERRWTTFGWHNICCHHRGRTLPLGGRTLPVRLRAHPPHGRLGWAHAPPPAKLPRLRTSPQDLTALCRRVAATQGVPSPRHLRCFFQAEYKSGSIDGLCPLYGSVRHAHRRHKG